MVVLVAGFWFMRTGDESSTSPARAERSVSSPAVDSLAVLPLRNVSGDSTQEYFVDAMTGAITDDLARIGALTVISARTMMGYKGSELTLPQIAREVGAKAFVTGSAV